MISGDPTRDMIPISKFFTYIRPLVGSSVPDAVLSHNIMEAIEWFCQETNILKDRARITVTPAIREYRLPIPEGRFMLAFIKMNQRRRTTAFASNNMFYLDQLGGLKASRMGNEPIIRFNYAPARKMPLQIGYVWMPDRDFEVCPLEIYLRFMNAIIYRAAMGVFLSYGELWSDLQRASLFEQKAEKEMVWARMDVASNYTLGPTEISAPTYLTTAYGAGFWG